jgi:hypothetical protein
VTIRNSQTLTILIERQPDGEYAAIDEANHDLGWPVGYGKTKRGQGTPSGYALSGFESHYNTKMHACNAAVF